MNYFDVLFAKKQSGGGTPTLITKTITENGTYSASDDNADGYSSVTVAVEGFKKKSITNTPTDIASFDDGTANPMPKLEIGIEPQQDLHGYDNPWVGGAGKNKFPYFNSQTLNGVTLTIGDDGTITLNGTCTESQNFIINGTIEAGAYSLCDFAEGQWPSLGNRTQIYAENIIQLTTYNVDESRTVRSAISTADGSIQFRIRIQNGFTYNNNKLKPMLVKGTVSTMTYEPYSNICPISGHTEADVTDCGVNLFDKDSTTVSNVTFEGESGTATRSGFELPLPNGNYYFKCFGATVQDYIFVYKNNAGNYIDAYYLSTESGIWLGANISVDTGDKLYVVAAYTGRTLDLSFDLDTVAGTTPPTTYSPYQGSTTSIPFHDASDNPITVYGGTLNVTSGELVVTHANIASYNGETINEPWISSMDVYSAGATPTTGAQVVYLLATPQTYQLTPTQVTTLLGQNNIFADCGQVLEGEYFVTL